MRIKINLLSLLRTLVRVAGQVATLGELVLAAHGGRSSDTGALDLDAAREAVRGAGQPAGGEPASNYQNDPSAAH